jgi:hypothetical protein
MLTLHDILFGVVLPFVLAGLILLLARMTNQRRPWAGPLAIGLAFSVGFGCVEGSAHLFPPASAVPWLFYLGLLFTLAGLLDATVRMPMWIRALIVGLATVLGAGLLLRFNFTNHVWDASNGSAWLIAIGIVAAIWWICFEFTAAEGGVLMPLGGVFICGIAGLVVMLVADQTVGQALGAMAIALAAAAAVVGWFKSTSLGRGTSAVVAGAGVCALAAAYFVSGVPIVDLSLIVIAPLALAAGSWLPLKNRRPWLRVVVRLMIVLVPLIIALGLAIAQFRKEAAENSADPYALAPSAYWGPLCYATPARCSAHVAAT